MVRRMVTDSLPGKALSERIRFRVQRAKRIANLAGGAALRAAPLDSGWFGPPRRFSPTAQQWCHGADDGSRGKRRCAIETVHGPLARARPSPGTLLGRTPWPFQAFYGGLATEDLPAHVYAISNARVCGEGAIIAPGDYLLGDVSRELIKDQRKHSILSRWRLPPMTDVDASVAVLAVAGSEVYWHWMFDCLPRLGLIMARKEGLGGVEQFVINAVRRSYQRETLEALGIEPAKCLQADRDRFHIKANMAIIPSITHQVPSVWACNFLRRELFSRLAVPAQETPRRIYVSRVDAGSRRVVNEEELVEELGRHGFVRMVMSPLTVAEQAALFAGAEVIVAPHGSGLTNLVFAKPGTKVIEIFPPQYVNPCFWAVADATGVDYYCMLGGGTLPPPPPDGWDAEDWFYQHRRMGSLHGEDIHVDIGEIKVLLRMAGIA